MSRTFRKNSPWAIQSTVQRNLSEVLPYHLNELMNFNWLRESYIVNCPSEEWQEEMHKLNSKSTCRQRDSEKIVSHHLMGNSGSNAS